MKKKLFALTLALCMVLCLAACGAEDFTAADFEGEWNTSADFSADIVEGITQESLDEAFGIADTARFLSVEDLQIPELPMELLLNADGSFTLNLDENSKQIIAYAVAAWFNNGDMVGLLTEVLTSQAEAAGVNLDDLMAYYGAGDILGLMEVIYGAPVDEYLAGLGEMISSGMDAELDLDSFALEGSWEYKGGKLLLSSGDGVDSLSVNDDASALTLPADGDAFKGDVVFTRG